MAVFISTSLDAREAAPAPPGRLRARPVDDREQGALCKPIPQSGRLVARGGIHMTRTAVLPFALFSRAVLAGCSSSLPSSCNGREESPGRAAGGSPAGQDWIAAASGVAPGQPDTGRGMLGPLGICPTLCCGSPSAVSVSGMASCSGRSLARSGMRIHTGGRSPAASGTASWAIPGPADRPSSALAGSHSSAPLVRAARHRDTRRALPVVSDPDAAG